MKQIFIAASIVAFILLLFFYVNKTTEINPNLSSHNKILNNDEDSIDKVTEDKFIKNDNEPTDGNSVVKNSNKTPEDLVLSAVKEFVIDDLNLKEDAIIVDSIHGEDWPDGCLGLPKPDEACTEMIVFGYEVELKFLGKEHKFRTNHDGSVIREEF